ncbi:DNA helicase RecQ [Bacteroidales bacterium OttesenSCG-928-K03]|nr:DNA helicase RecQ [Odoribacter sp. OttesenSCG-928-L07]MDL2239443.1 DNA helicase RecQ [Bacteroidales bacterium OttesenSCG-928-L14]MDL2240564.1 DNA helicase RecQ [Bacteroidales bacterium OttesenSCG-928-K22]MDL2242654.1 DNA helicase RecQ [Bacteroidales bacterium OttesenSCG-928-K03]
MTKMDQYSLHDLLKKVFGFDSFKGDQEAIIRSVLDGHDTFVIMPTGSGKSMCYQLPAIISEGTAIIISPLIALMKNQVDAIRNFGQEKGIAHVLNSSLTRTETQQVKDDVLSGKTKLLYVAPESLTKEDKISFFKKVNISFYAIDEAHCISEWGHDFRPEYRRIRPIVDAIGQKVPIIALTATATPKVQQDIQKNLNMLNANLFKTSFNRPNLYYEVRSKDKDVVKEIIKYIKNNQGKSGIIYCLSRKKVEEIAEVLTVNNIKALPYHAGLDSTTRKRNQDMFLMEEVDVIVATIAFGMGIDKPDVRFVIHYDIPKSLEGYYQETGRAGRDDGEGNCIAFYSYDDILKLEKFMAKKTVAEKEISAQLLQETIAYADTAICRRKQLLHYFGETYKDDNCHNCDNCIKPKETYDAQDDLILVLETVQEIKGQFKENHILNIILGENNTTIKQCKHNKLPMFGKGSSNSEKYWLNVIRHALVGNFISKDIENYGLLKISEKGLEFLEEPYAVTFTREPEEDEENEDMIVSGDHKTSSCDKVLFSLLKNLRKDISKKENLPPFVIFQDPSLEDMAIQYPITMAELTNITGVGQGKAAKYGKPFLDLIKVYVEENDIIRPNDMVVKSVINKSGLKVYIIQSIDRKLSLDDIAYTKGIELDELLTEMESIVASGTKLNIDYYINENIDLEHQEEIIDYFSEAHTDSIQDALVELGENEYTEEEIRLMRLKYISEVGN